MCYRGPFFIRFVKNIVVKYTHILKFQAFIIEDFSEKGKNTSTYVRRNILYQSNQIRLTLLCFHLSNMKKSWHFPFLKGTCFVVGPLNYYLTWVVQVILCYRFASGVVRRLLTSIYLLRNYLANLYWIWYVASAG